MPPKKNVNKTGAGVVPKISKEKVPKPRIKKEKPKLKNPTVFKVKISRPGTGMKDSPSKENVTSTINTEVPPAIPTSKLDRINEVARAQLVKGSPVNTEMPIPEKKKRGRKKKIQTETVPEPVVASTGVAKDCFGNTIDKVVEKKKKVCKKKKIQPQSETDPDNSGEIIPTKKVKRSPKVKPSSNGLVKKPEVSPDKNTKKLAKSTKPVLKRQNQSKVNSTVTKRTTRGKTIDEDSTLTSPSIATPRKDEAHKNNEELVVSPTVSTAIGFIDLTKDKKTPATKKKVKRKYVKRNAVIDEDSTITSPSILSQGLLDKTHDKEIQKPFKMASENTKKNDSRRTSVTSASEWSWTKDISGSSTTTCITVMSNDFVRIDGKLPIVKLNNCDALVANVRTPPPEEEKKEDENSLSGDSSSSSSSRSSESSTSSTKTTYDNFLNLSTSSVSPVKSTPRSLTKYESYSDATEQLTTLEKLALTLKKVNLGFHAWSDNDGKHLTQMETYEKNIFKVMSEEHSVLSVCGLLSKILSKECVVSEKIGDTAEVAEKETDFAKPSAGAIANVSGHEAPKRRDSMAYDPNDDDDALSIFAESFTGFDSSRFSSNASVTPDIPQHEEYVPQPVRDTWAPVERTYRPSKIDETLQNTKKLVCEKQNADSTSLHKEPEITAPAASENVVENSSNVVNEVEQSQGVSWDQQQQLTISTFKPQSGMRSMTLKGVCFFNLVSKCMKIRCAFAHRMIGEGEFSGRLVKLSEEQFISEFLLMVKFSALRIKYMPCFVAECQRRDLPKILVEMVIVFISKSNLCSIVDMTCKVDTVESTLLYLNNVNLAVCEDRLKYAFIGGKHLCEVFMETIANTQNFWRFKPVFLALANFMVREKRTFSLEVAAHILERVCIFKFEQPLALVLLSIIELTDSKIFDSSMMDIFEKQLQSFSTELHERFLAAKNRSGVVVPPESPAGSSLARSQEPELPSSIIHSDPENRYTSPDTTNLDNLNKPEPIITRTVNLDKIRSLTTSTPHNSFKRIQQSWNHRSIYDMIPRFTPPMQGPRYPLKRPMGRQVQYGPRQCKYPRRSGPDFYGNQ